MISVIIPVIREEQAKETIRLAKDNAGVDCEVLTEVDTDRIGCPKMVRRLVSRAKYDLICFIGDDCTPEKDYLLNAVKAMKGLKDEWGLVGLNDGTDRDLPAHWLAHTNMLDHLENREFFYTGYTHCYCDMELRDKARGLDRYVHSKESVVTHNHPALTGEDTQDEDYIRVYSDEVRGKDRNLYFSRKVGKDVLSKEINCPHCKGTITMMREREEALNTLMSLLYG